MFSILTKNLTETPGLDDNTNFVEIGIEKDRCTNKQIANTNDCSLMFHTFSFSFVNPIIGLLKILIFRVGELRKNQYIGGGTCQKMVAELGQS